MRLASHATPSDADLIRPGPEVAVFEGRITVTLPDVFWADDAARERRLRCLLAQIDGAVAAFAERRR